jgi:cell division protein ZapA (FtsZ GTPase activity inhibitor)
MSANKKEKLKELKANNHRTDEIALNYLAGILVSIYLDQNIHEHTRNPKECSDILPCVDQGTG